MTTKARDRVESAIRHEPAAHVPVGPFIGHYAARFAGMSILEYITSGRNIALAQMQLWQKLHHDIVVTAADTYYIAQAFGLEVNFSEDALPTAGRAPIQSLGEISRLKIPDPYRDGRMPVYLDAVARLHEQLHGEAAVRGTGTGPFTLAAHLMGIQDFLTKLVEIDHGLSEPWEEQAIFELLDIASQTLIGFLKAQILAGEDIVYIGDSLASLDVISPPMYRKYAFPCHKKVIDAIDSLCRQKNAHSLLHICGDNTAILPDLAATGAEMLDIDSKMDLAVCKQVVGSQVCLVGNLDPVRVLLQGSPDLVFAESIKCIRAAGSGGGFILGTGCFVSLMTPFENLEQMVAAARSDIDPD